MISLIVAISKNGVIGKSQTLPWYLPADLAHFKQTTLGHPIIMGRVTHESIGRALPGRRNIVITRNKSYRSEGCDVVNSLNSALKLVEHEKEVFVIGGENIYTQALPYVEKIYLTEVGIEVEGDKYFKFEPKDWTQLSRVDHQKDSANPYDYSFVVLQRSS